MLYYTKTRLLNTLKGSKVKSCTKPGNSKTPLHYINTAVTWDSETTSTYYKGEKVAFIYLWAFRIFNTTIYGRTVKEFKELVETLSEYYNLDDNNRMIVYIHNLPFDFSFIENEFNWSDVFATDAHKVIYACTNGVELRDSSILSGCSLAKLELTWPEHKDLHKLCGELDYELIRTPNTPITDKELAYQEADVVVLQAYIEEQIKLYKSIARIPFTNTGRVRKYARQLCLNNKNGYNWEYKDLMDNLTLKPEEYEMCKSVFAGGFTHANATWSNIVVDEHVTAFDFTSSYPAVILSEKFPMSKPHKLNKIKDFNYMINNYCCMFTAKFVNLRSTRNEQYISEYKTICKGNKEVNNGRIVSADSLIVNLTDIDFKIIKEFYKWDEIYVKNFYYFDKDYLPKELLQVVLDLYKDKTNLKGVDGKEAEYQLKKGMLNSCYGMMVTAIDKGEWMLDEDGWYEHQCDLDKCIKDYNNDKRRFLYYPWGVWVTAYARRNLFTGIYEFGDDYIYADTDSIYAMNAQAHEEYIAKYNNTIANKIKKCCDARGLDFNATRPKTIEGEEKPLGVWDYDGEYDLFKTLGAKRYIGYNKDKDKWKFTLAGVSKKEGLKYMLSKYGIDMFDYFTDNLIIPSDYSGKLTHTYFNKDIECNVKDYLGNVSKIHVTTGCHLEKSEFRLSELDIYIDYIRKVQKEARKKYE